MQRSNVGYMKIDMSSKGIISLVVKNYYVFILIAIFLLAFWIRAVPARFNELPGLDEFLFYRYSDYALNHNLQLPEIDYMRHHPTGINVQESEYIAPIYIPIFLYMILSTFGLFANYFTFVLYYPPLMGAFAALAMFFLGKEVYDVRAGLLSAFFLATEPAFITRTIAGLIEKEAAIAPFTVLTIFFFIRAFRKKSIPSAVLAGLSLAVVGMSSGITQYFYAILALFALIMLLFNKNTENLIKSYLPTMVIALILPALLVKHSTSIHSTELPVVSFTLFITGIVVLRFLVEKVNLVKNEQLKYVSPGIVILFFLGFLISTMFVDQTAGMLSGIIKLANLEQKDPTGFTVAENQPGSWGNILESSNTNLAGNYLPQLSSISIYFSIWAFTIGALIIALYKMLAVYPFFKRLEAKAFLLLVWLVAVPILSSSSITSIHVMVLAVIGIGMLLHKSLKQPMPWVMVLLLIWLSTGMLAVLFQIRLLFIFGPIAALLAGFALSYFVNAVLRLSATENQKIKSVAKHMPFFVLILLVLVVVENAATAQIYTAGQGTSICVANPQILINGQKCLEIDDKGNITYASGQPWYDAFTFMSTQTPEDSNFLSWWDFGYWFQTRGKRPSVSDGGGGYRDQIARWFMAEYTQWDEVKKFLLDREVDYVFMDYTLPGKYGAITAIGSEGKDIKGIAQFSQNNQFTEGGKTIVEFVNGPYAIWMPIQGTSVSGPPMFLQRQGDSYAQAGFINELCTETGIVAIGNETNTIGGCVAITSIGVFYLRDDVKNTIFSRLMFMKGVGLPVEKVFDNAAIQIYKLNR